MTIVTNDVGRGRSPERPIGEHAVVGDLNTAALVAADGTIDFLCWPNLDSPSLFASLLDAERGGEFSITPQLREARQLQLYVPETNVLITRWLTPEASVEVIDFMPHSEVALHPAVVRHIHVTKGVVEIHAHCKPRPGYAREVPGVTQDGDGVRFDAPSGRWHLYGDMRWTPDAAAAEARFSVREGTDAWIVLCDSDKPVLTTEDLRRVEAATVRAWRNWSRSSTYDGRWREQVNRSALALKLLTSHRHGSIAAAVTFGLPESPGGVRNWDYRATWLRDASFTVYALLRLGYRSEAQGFRDWLSRIVETPETLAIMYALDGSKISEETELEHLRGHRGAAPVQVGNDARDQQQLDVFGESVDSLFLMTKYGSAVSHEVWTHLRATVDYLGRHWNEPDAGIWEVRGPPRHFLHSRLMCWVAVDRIIRLARKRSLPGPVTRWEELRDEIHADIWANFRHPEHGYFVRERGGRTVDGALLMMPLARFVSATDPVWLSTLDAIHHDLADDGLLWRYREDDGLPGNEGAFVACMFWYVECLARAGRLDEALLEMEKCLSYANHVGLYAEELDQRGFQLGNFPQGLSHLAMISAASALSRRLGNGYAGEWEP